MMFSESQVAEKAFERECATPPRWVARAPGRVNLIGEYTDCDGGFVLPIALNKSSSSGPVLSPTFIMDPSLMAPEAHAQGKALVTQFPNQGSEQRAPLKLAEDETLKLQVDLDRSVIEVFANGRQAMTQVVYPELATSTGVKLFSGGEPVTLKTGQSWQMAEAN